LGRGWRHRRHGGSNHRYQPDSGRDGSVCSAAP
jgi:hypothetical protein